MISIKPFFSLIDDPYDVWLIEFERNEKQVVKAHDISEYRQIVLVLIVLTHTDRLQKIETNNIAK